MSSNIENLLELQQKSRISFLFETYIEALVYDCLGIGVVFAIEEHPDIEGYWQAVRAEPVFPKLLKPGLHCWNYGESCRSSRPVSLAGKLKYFCEVCGFDMSL